MAAALLVAERAEQVDATRREGLRRTLISLFNCPQITYKEKLAALAHLEAIRADLPRLTTWERNVRAEVEHRCQTNTGKAGHHLCRECQAPIGYNPEFCGTCYRAIQHQS